MLERLIGVDQFTKRPREVERFECFVAVGKTSRDECSASVAAGETNRDSELVDWPRGLREPFVAAWDTSRDGRPVRPGTHAPSALLANRTGAEGRCVAVGNSAETEAYK